VGVTFRSIVIGLVLIPLNALWLATTEVVWISGQPTTLSLFYNVVWILFWLILANLLIQRFRPAWALRPAELLVVYSMLSISSALGSLDFIDVLVPMLTTPHYYNELTGAYVDSVSYVPDWLLVTDPTAFRSYYLGQESIYDAANFLPWLRPLAAWTVFIFALCAVMWGLDLVFRKQWTEHEKLAYPVIQMPMRLAVQTKALFASKAFWVAFGAAAVVDIVNGLSFMFPMLPKLPLVHIVQIQEYFPNRPWNARGAVPVSIYPFAVGMCFFMPLDLAFSCWFFFIFWKLQRVMASHIGVHGMPGFPFVEEQTAGGYYALALLALWVSHSHLRRFLRVLAGRAHDRVTPWERQETRVAAILIVAGLAVLLTFCLLAKMSLGVVATFFSLYFLLSIGITRMRAELGHPSHDLHFIGPNVQIIKFLGAPNLKNDSPHDLGMLGFFNWFNRAYRGHPMPHGLEAFRIAERQHMDNRRYLIAMGVAVAAGTLCAFWALLVILNKYGATQISGLGDGFGQEGWNVLTNRFIAPEPHQYQPTYAILVGVAFAGGLALMRMTLAWWPFHPVGYAVSGSWSMDQLWMSFFVAWLIKLLLLKYGGVKTYKPAVPFFVGLILGDFIAGGFWNLYGAVMGVSVYHFWPY